MNGQSTVTRGFNEGTDPIRTKIFCSFELVIHKAVSMPLGWIISSPKFVFVSTDEIWYAFHL